MKTATSCGRKNGFSLAELPVILGVVALLTLLMVKAAAHRAKEANQNAQCLANTRQLTAAWLMYAGDYNDRCCNNFGPVQTDMEASAHTYQTWSLNALNWFTSADNTNVALLQHGLLNPYVGGNAAVFRCPEDNYLSGQQRAAGFQARVRSYTMNGFFGHYSGCANCGNGGVNSGPDNTYLGRNQINTSYRQFLTVGSVPKSSGHFVFIDTAPDSVTYGYFDAGIAPTTWTAATSGGFSTLPASYHNGAAGVSFADGHAEIHRWVDKTFPGSGPLQSGAAGVIRPVTYSGTSSIADSSPYPDIHWMWSHEGTPF